jgi:GT2 family glycosyltransferase
VLPSLSIVIPTRHRLDLLRACLQSVVRHAPLATETLVVDDASHDSGPARVVADFPGIRCLRLPRPRGFATAANAGLREARGEFVEFLNDDTEVCARWAEAALTGFDDPEVGAVAPLVLFHPATQPSIASALRLDSAGDRYNCGGVAGKRGHGQALAPGPLKPGRVFGASASSAFYRRAVLEKLGGFPESFGAYFEDVDVAFRLHWAGWQTQFQPESRVFHHVGGSYRRSSRRLLEMQSRNEERVFWRNVPRRSLLRALPSHAVVLAAKAWRRYCYGELLPFVMGRLRLLGEVGAIRSHRRWLHQKNPQADWRAWQVEDCFWH